MTITNLTQILMQIYTFTKYIIRIAVIIFIPIIVLACENPGNTLDDNLQGGSIKIGIRGWYETISPLNEDSSPYSSWGPGIAYSRILNQKISQNLNHNDQLSCDICKEWSMENPTEFNFSIKDDIPWSTNNYEKDNYVSAYDIEFSIQKKLDTKSQNKHTLHMVKNIEAKSDTKLTIYLKYPDADFLTAIANGKNKIIKKDHTYNNTEVESLVGSGSWVLDKYIPYTSARMNKSMNSKNTPNLDSIEFTHIPDDQARYSAYVVGLTDIYSLDDSENNFGDIQPKLLYPHSGLGLEIIINTKNEPFDNIKLRQALMYSINPTQIAEEAWYGRGYFSLGFPVYSDNWLPNSTWEQYFNQPEKSSRILDESQKLLPIPIEITSSDYGEKYTKSLEIISKNLIDVGFDPTIKILNRREYSTNSWLSGNFQINVGPTLPQTTPNGYLLPILHSTGKWNTSNYSTQKLDNLLTQQAQEYSHLERTKLINAINLEILNGAHRFMPVTTIEAWDWKDHIRNFNPIFKNDEYSHWDYISLKK